MGCQPQQRSCPSTLPRGACHRKDRNEPPASAPWSFTDTPARSLPRGTIARNIVMEYQPAHHIHPSTLLLQVRPWKRPWTTTSLRITAIRRHSREKLAARKILKSHQPLRCKNSSTLVRWSNNPRKMSKTLHRRTAGCRRHVL